MTLVEHNRKRSQGKQPITRHPLFPATVALWFGTLFGLGGFAVRPSLLEAAVLAIHLDTIIPAAAPPLGITFRLLLALALAGVGGLLGAYIGRALARPAQETRERRRGAFAGLREARTDRPVVEAELEDSGAWPGIGSRRRALAITDEPASFDYAERAPLPGGAPQILNVADVDIGPFDEAGPLAPEPAHAAEPEPEMLDLSGFDDEPDDRHGDFAALKQSFAEAMREGTSPALPPQSFGRNFDRSVADEAAPAIEPPAGRPHDGSERFVAFRDTEPEDEADFAMPQSASSHGRTFDAPADSRSFPATSGEPVAAPPRQWHDAGDFARSGVAQDESVIEAGHSREDPVEAAPFAEPVATAAPASDDLGSLSHGALLDRLALSLQRRRDAAPTAEVVSAVSQALAGISPAGGEMSELRTDRESVADPVGEAAGEDVAAACAAAADDEPAEPAAAIPPAPLALPAALRSISFAEIDEDEEDWLPGFVPARHIAMPAASARADACADAECETATPVAASEDLAEPAVPTTGDAAAAAAPVARAGQAGESDGEEGVLEAGYASLLGLTQRAPVRQGFIRIDEPEASEAAIEPVVVFPGQGARLDGAEHAPRRFDGPDQAHWAPSPPPAAEGAPTPGLRRFDAPGDPVSEPGVPVKAPPAGAPDPQDREETERALRAALSNLQRMSGTA